MNNRRRLLTGALAALASAASAQDSSSTPAAAAPDTRALEKDLANSVVDAAGKLPQARPLFKPLSHEQVRSAFANAMPTPQIHPSVPTIWVWYTVGDTAADRFLAQVVPVLDQYRDRVAVQYFAALMLNLAVQVSETTESVWASKVEAAVDFNGRHATLYAGGQIPAIVWVNGAQRQIVRPEGLRDHLESFFSP